jgi:hypothetical protein
VSSGLLNSSLKFSAFSTFRFFYNELLAHHITLKLLWFLCFNLPGKEDPASNYATTGIALKVIEKGKPSCHMEA